MTFLAAASTSAGVPNTSGSLGFTLPISTVVAGTARRASAMSSFQSTSRIFARVRPMSAMMPLVLPQM